MTIEHDYFGDSRNLFPEEVKEIYEPLAVGEFKDVILNMNSQKEKISNIAKRSTYSLGINWGYIGTGPGDLALSILLHFSNEDFEFTKKFYYDFMTEILAKLPQKPVVVSHKMILAWIRQAREKGHPDQEGAMHIYFCGSDYYFDSQNENLIKRKKKSDLSNTPRNGEGGFYGK